MTDRPTVQKAKITSVSDSSKSVTCHFNPDTFSLDRTVKWNVNTSIGGDVSNVSFAGGEPIDMSLTLLFDTTDTGSDVRTAYAVLIDLSEIDQTKTDAKTQKGEPHLCRFEWGLFLTFTAVITKVAQKFTMFKADGTPLRAEVTVTLKQVPETTGAQNPTTRVEPRKIWIVHEGQTLNWIAYKEYGNPVYWRHIAETNNLDDPLDLKPGQVLKLTPLP